MPRVCNSQAESRANIIHQLGWDALQPSESISQKSMTHAAFIDSCETREENGQRSERKSTALQLEWTHGDK